MAVVKVGGSVLRDRSDYARAAESLAGRDDLVVVSAAYGVTDRLVEGHFLDQLWADHEALAAAPLPAHLRRAFEGARRAAQAGRSAELLAWGEQASCTILQGHLEAIGKASIICEVGTSIPRQGLRLVPGFYRREGSDIIVLDRGGSDVTAVELAVTTWQDEVEFWKDGGGIWDGEAVVATTGHQQLLARLGQGIRPLHHEAVRRAWEAGIRLRLVDPTGHRPSTTVA